MISVTCVCGSTRQVAEMFAGRRVKCPECGAMVEVPGATAAPAASVVAGAAAAPAEPAPAKVLSSRSDARSVRRHLPFSSMAGACMVVAFFMPWVRASCVNFVIAEPSGYNLATNTLDSNARELVEKGESLKEKAEGKSEAPLIGLLEPVKGEGEQQDPPWGSKTKELWIFPALGVAVAGWAGFRWLRPSYAVGRETALFLALALGAGGLLIYERMTWYGKKPLQDLKKDMSRRLEELPQGFAPPSKDAQEIQKEMLELVTLRDQPGFWLTAIALAAVAIRMAAWLMTPASGTD